MGSAFRCGHLRRSQHKSLCANGADHRPLVSLVDLATQSPHVNVHKIGLGDELIVPDFPEKHCSRQHLALAPHHVFDQKQFTRPEVDRTLIALDGARQKIEPQRADAEDCFPAVGGWPQKLFYSASNSAMAATLAGFIFIGSTSVLGNRDEPERVSSTLLLIIEFSFLRLTHGEIFG